MNRVSLAWFGHNGYERTLRGLKNVHTLSSLKFASIDMPPFHVKLGMPIITSENRIVSKADQIPAYFEDVPIEDTVDPKDIIRKNLLKKNPHRYRHVQDNVVSFYKPISEPTCVPGSPNASFSDVYSGKTSTRRSAIP